MNDGASRTTESEGAVFAFLERGLEELATEVTPSQIEQLADLVSLLDRWAARINLTGHRDAIEMAGRLVLDAAALGAAVPEIALAESVADLGTGAGFPGLPLAILNPGVRVFLVDSRKKRNHFQREVRRRLSVGNAEPILGRVEEVETRSADVVVAQAMAEPDQALALMVPWSSPSGVLVLPASERAEPPVTPDGWRDPEIRDYEVPLTGVLRKIWIVRRAF